MSLQIDYMALYRKLASKRNTTGYLDDLFKDVDKIDLLKKGSFFNGHQGPSGTVPDRRVATRSPRRVKKYWKKKQEASAIQVPNPDAQGIEKFLLPRDAMRALYRQFLRGRYVHRHKSVSRRQHRTLPRPRPVDRGRSYFSFSAVPKPIPPSPRQ